MSDTRKKCAVITGASSGIGEATARALFAVGYEVVLGARRVERVQALAAALGAGARAVHLDVTAEASVEALAAQVGEVAILVNNAGLSRGLARLEDAPDEHWQSMLDTNVMGLFRVTRALLPRLRAGVGRWGHAHIVNVGSIAGFQTYVGGSGYTASKHAVRAITQTLRLELVGEPIRVTEVNPGLVETEFSLVRFDGDIEKARKPYAGIEPLLAADIADLIQFAVTRPPHVNIDEIVVKPVRQASASLVVRD